MEFYRDASAIKSAVLCQLKEQGLVLPDSYALRIDCRGNLVDIRVVDTSIAKCAFKVTVCVDITSSGDKVIRIEGVCTPFEFRLELFNAIKKVFSMSLSEYRKPSTSPTATAMQQSTKEVSKLGDYVKICSVDTDFLSAFKSILGTFNNNFKFVNSCNDFTDVLAHNSSIEIAKKLIEVSKSTLLNKYRNYLESAIDVYGSEKLPKSRQTVTLSSPEKRISETVQGHYIASEGALPSNTKICSNVSLTHTTVNLINFKEEVSLTAEVSQVDTISVSASEYTNLIPFCRAVSLAFSKPVVATYEDGVKITVEPPDSELMSSWVEVGCIDIDLYDDFANFASSNGCVLVSRIDNGEVDGFVFSARVVDSKAYISALYKDYQSVLDYLLEYKDTILHEFSTRDIVI